MTKCPICEGKVKPADKLVKRPEGVELYICANDKCWWAGGFSNVKK